MAEESHDKGHGGGHGAHKGGHGHGPGGGHGGEHEESGAPEWLISFADNVALLMGFFVILLAMNMAKPTAGGIGGEGAYPNTVEPEILDFILDVRRAFNNPVSPDSDDPAEAPLVKRLLERRERGETTDPGPDGDAHNVQAPRTSAFVSVTGMATFAENSDQLTPEARLTLKTVAVQLRGYAWIIEVRGHVSAAEARLDKELAMDLAHRRAKSTARALVDAGVPWNQLRLVACADNERATPIAHDRAEHRNNQRAEVVVTQETVPPDPYSAEEPAPRPERSARGASEEH